MKERTSKGRCQAEVHHPACDGWADNTDHFTPRCLIRALRLDRKLLRDPENMIRMNYHCHEMKDAPTPQVLRQAKMQKGGRFIRFGEHIA
jgi:hypothetical protein